MSILSRVLVGFILVASIGFFILAAYNLKARTAWEQEIQRIESLLPPLARQIEVLRNGDRTATPPQLGIRDLEIQMHDLMASRGKVWRGCTVQKAQGNEVVVDVPLPDPHQIQDKMVLYAFEEGEQGGYIAEFKVAGIADKNVSLQLTMSFQFPWQLNRINQSSQRKVPWSLYEKMPGDRHDVFQGLNQQQLAAVMPGRPPNIRPVPPEVLEEYVRDGTPAQPNDPPERVMNGKYERVLNDYEVYFHWVHAQIASLNDQIAAATTDLGLAEKLRDDAQQEVAGRQKTIDETVKPELTKVQYELATIGGHLAALQKKLAEVEADIQQTRSENKRLAAQWTAWQLGAAERLNDLIARDQARASP
ncbi:MAG TPA: hypothetical protein VFW87_02855 [Pirellulales bacterium]|nr:hypothetical protein [Pirellulales bacterium]